MTVRTRMLAFSLPLAALAVAALLLAWDRSDAPTAEAGGPMSGMSLSAPATVGTGSTFVVTIAANPLPGPESTLSGYATEVVLPTGLTWVPRATCGDEVLGNVGGANPPLCIRNNAPVTQAVRHVAGTGLVPPLPGFDAPLTNLVQFDVTCDSAGTYQLNLTEVPDSAFGAVYFDIATLGIEMNANETSKDTNGDTTLETLADTTNVNCQDPTPTFTPTDTPTRTPTATPCQVQGVPCTPTPTNTPGPTDTPTETPVSLPSGTIVVGPVGNQTPTDASGSNAVLYLVLGTLLVAGVAGAGLFAWRRYPGSR